MSTTLPSPLREPTSPPPSTTPSALAPRLPARRLVTIQAAADHLDISTKTVRRYIAAGLLTAYRVGPRLLKIDVAEVDGLLHPIPTAAGGSDVAP